MSFQNFTLKLCEKRFKVKNHSKSPPKTDFHHLTDELISNQHLSSFSVCKSKSLGDCIVVGNVGAGTEYSGIEIYKLRPNTETLINQILQLNHTIPHPEYLKLINSITGTLLLEIPVCEQLRGYCGLRSATELNEYTRLFFTVLHNLGPQTGLDEALEITEFLHNKFMNFIREKIGLQFLDELRNFNGKDKLELADEFFQDLYVQATRYNVSDEFLNKLKRYMQDHNILNIFPQSLYKDYLLHDRSALPWIEPPPRETHHQKILDEQCECLISLYRTLHSDFNETVLEELAFLDDRIQYCVVSGFDNARALAYNSRGPDSTDEQLRISVLNRSVQELNQTQQRALIKFSR